jgi:undecaprenyl-diphosphatase
MRKRETKRRGTVLARTKARALPARRRRHPVLAALGDADQAVLRFLRTRGHHEPVETMMQAIGMCGEYAAVWAVAGGVGASIDEKRRRQWLVAAAAGPAAVGVNFVAKVAFGRQRPLIEEHPPLAKAPTKLSFPSAHATSSIAAATALGRVEPRARPALFTLAAAVCIGRPYLGMHYPSDVVAGAILGFAIGRAVPGLGAPPTEDRLFELAIDANERAQATTRAGGNGGASSTAPADEPAEPSSESA